MMSGKTVSHDAIILLFFAGYLVVIQFLCNTHEPQIETKTKSKMQVGKFERGNTKIGDTSAVVLVSIHIFSLRFGTVLSGATS